MPHSFNAAAASPIAAPWLSILIPVYNVEAFLRECVASMMEQCGSDGIEVILLDDCSTDGSWPLCQKLAKAYAGRLHIMQHNNNQGPSAARNHLLAAATGDYVWFVDSDDTITSNALCELKEIIDNGAPDLVICDYYRGRFTNKFGNLISRHVSFKKTFPGRGGKFQNDQTKLIEGVFLCRKMYACMKIARRSLWTAVGFPVGRYFEDVAAVPHLLLKSHRYYYAPKKWYCYRITPNSVMTSLRKSPHVFDIQKNGDIAAALEGYSDAVKLQLGSVPPAIAYAMAHFIGKEYVKLAGRFQIADQWARANGGEPDNVSKAPLPLRHYRDQMEASSPLSFSRLRREYLKRLKIWDYFALSRSMARAVRPL